MAVRSRKAKKGAANGSEKPILKAKKKTTVCSCRRVLLLLLFLYASIIPVIRYSTWFQRALIYQHYIRVPLFSNYSDVSSFNISQARDFQLTHGDGCTLHVWQVPPLASWKARSPVDERDYLSMLTDGRPVVLYLHGNFGTRATHHRVAIYKYLSEQRGYHVIAFDYRGFAESDCNPSERGVIEDGYLVWKWLKQHVPSNRIFVWGHSLGSSVATHLTEQLCQEQDCPKGMILDAPFTTIAEAGYYHPITAPLYPIKPLLKALVLDSALFEKFETVNRIHNIHCPILIAHGRNDWVVPYELGAKVYRTAIESEKLDPSQVTFVDCGNASHKTNYQSDELHTTLDHFIDKHWAAAS